MPIRAFFVMMTLVLSAVNANGQSRPKSLSLDAAIQAALENNASVQISEEQEIQARARTSEQRSAFLPNVNHLLSYTNQKINLGSRGLDFPGLPTTVGPFNNTEVRLQ